MQSDGAHDYIRVDTWLHCKRFLTLSRCKPLSSACRPAASISSFLLFTLCPLFLHLILKPPVVYPCLLCPQLGVNMGANSGAVFLALFLSFALLHILFCQLIAGSLPPCFLPAAGRQAGRQF